jgi:hypothetical protein
MLPYFRKTVRLGGPHFEEFRDAFSRERGNLAVQLVFEPSAGIHKADLLPVLGPVKGAEVLKAELAAPVLRPPEGGSGTVAKEAQTDEHARFVV